MKTPLQNKPPQFDLKFLLVGNSGSGKTHFAGTYTSGPVHFYMLDPGGEKTLYKLNKDRKPGCEITIDSFSPRNDKYTTFWKQLQRDEKDGFFAEMSERKGLIVLPDSLTTANDMIVEETARKNGRSLTNTDKAMRIQDWGVASQWMKELVGVINDLPCAVVAIAHLVTDYDDEGAVAARYPSVTGKFSRTMGRYFDEIYLLETMGSKRKVVFTEKGKFQASSRIFQCKDASNITMQDLADAYMNGDDLSIKR